MANKDKICNICSLKIDESKPFAIFTEMSNAKVKKSEGYYHIECFRERLSGGTALKNIHAQANAILSFAKKRLGMEDEKEVVKI